MSFCGILGLTRFVMMYRAKRIKVLVARIIKEGEVPRDAQFAPTAAALIPLIEKTARKLKTLVDLNNKVHARVFKHLMTEAAVELSSEA